MELAQLIGTSALVILVYMSLLFIIAFLRKDNSIADIGWGIGFMLIAFAVMFIQSDYTFRQIVITVLIFLWGTRLSARIYKRNRGKGEDFGCRIMALFPSSKLLWRSDNVVGNICNKPFTTLGMGWYHRADYYNGTYHICFRDSHS